ncbi:MAG: hypothetical protein ACLP5E_14675, partial [Streptosporangiaceae bacterium]
KVPNQVKIATRFDGSMSNLIAAINYGPGSGTVYSTNTARNLFVYAGLLTTNHSFTVTAWYVGPGGNTNATTTTSTNLTWVDGATLTGGANAVTGSTNIVFTGYGPAGAFINHSLVTDFGSTIYVTNFESDGVISNGSLGTFTLQAQTATLTNGAVYAGGNINLTANTLLASNVSLLAGRGLTLQAAGSISDGLLNGGVFTNGNLWSVGTTNGASGNGLALTALPAAGDLLGTTITNYVGSTGNNPIVQIIWAAQDRGVSTTGYTNDVAVGHLILDSLSSGSTFQFNGVGVSNAMYVDWLDLQDFAVNKDLSGSNYTALSFTTNAANPNLVIYYARATVGGVDTADKMNGKNGNHLRWVPQYTGYFSGTNIVYPDGTTNFLNTSLIQSGLDSNGNGIANDIDSAPIFTPSQWHVVITPPSANNTNTAEFVWHSIPGATNAVYSAALMPPYAWQVLTNFVSPPNVPPVGGWPITNVFFYQFTGTMTNYGTLGVWVYPNSITVYGQ